MHRAPRPPNERVITRRTWAGIFFVGAIMAVGTLYVLDASMPGGFVEGTGSRLRYASPARTFSSGPDRQQCVNARHFDSVALAENRAQRR